MQFIRRLMTLGVVLFIFACGGGDETSSSSSSSSSSTSSSSTGSSTSSSSTSSSSSGAGYTNTDLSGNWYVVGIATGPGAPYYGRGTGTATSSTFNFSIIDSLGIPENISGTWDINSSGLVFDPSTTGGDIAHLDSGKTIIATVQSDPTPGSSADSSKLHLQLKRATSYSLSELDGNWNMYSISSGAVATRVRRFMTINNGSVTGTRVDQNGTQDVISETIQIDNTGTVTSPTITSPNYLGYVDAGKTVAVFSDIDAGTAEMSIAVKLANSYSNSDLEGTWQGYIISAGDGAPWWQQAFMVVNASGQANAYVRHHNGNTENKSSTINTSTRNTFNFGSEIEACSLDEHKTVFVCNNTWSGSNTHDLFVFVKTSFGNGTPQTINAANLAGVWRRTDTDIWKAKEYLADGTGYLGNFLTGTFERATPFTWVLNGDTTTEYRVNSVVFNEQVSALTESNLHQVRQEDARTRTWVKQ